MPEDEKDIHEQVAKAVGYNPETDGNKTTSIGFVEEILAAIKKIKGTVNAPSEGEQSDVSKPE